MQEDLGRISVVIPTINEEKTIGEIVHKLKTLGSVQVIVVDTKSTDRTREIAAENGAEVIDQPSRGYGLAYKTGLSRADGEVIVCLDGDGTYPVDMVKPLIEILEFSDVDFISCDRMTLRNNVNYTTLHYVGNSVLNIFIRVLFNFPLKDSQSGMWVFRKSIYERMKILSDGMSFSQDIKIEALRHGTLIEVPIRYGVRVTKPKLRTWRDGFSNLFHLMVKRISE
ncbi:MAG: glycosyltransferase family 2 protein [Thermoplasmataceae archaeon]|jgi:glycosyltransferase involved in cell wall biosynthesis|nr:glycosyltransferase family 2 protein [Candidatus Thermoplasmatota archaeon]